MNMQMIVILESKLFGRSIHRDYDICGLILKLIKLYSTFDFQILYAVGFFCTKNLLKIGQIR